MSTSLLVEYYQRLPQPRQGDDPDAWAATLQGALDEYRRQVAARYTEGTLQRMLTGPDADNRRAATLALSLVGTIDSNAVVAARLHDADPTVRRLAADALWALWFRAGTPAQNEELQRLSRLRDPHQAVAGFEALLKDAPTFAEAFNQRAILYFRLGDFHKSVNDCERVLKLNPHHFGAQAGIGQCYLKLKKPRAALRAFRNALRINPNLDEVRDTVRDLEESLKKGDD